MYIQCTVYVKISKFFFSKVICTSLSEVYLVTMNQHGSWATLLDTVQSTSVLHLYIWASITNFIPIIIVLLIQHVHESIYQKFLAIKRSIWLFEKKMFPSTLAHMQYGGIKNYRKKFKKSQIHVQTLAGSCGGKAKTLQHISKGIYLQYEILIYR